MNLKLKNEFPMTVVFEDDGSMTIEWDSDHPMTSIFNSWTEEEFTNCFLNAANSILERNNGN